jgi:hypothetical protein
VSTSENVFLGNIDQYEIQWLSVAMEVGNDACGKQNSHIEHLLSQMEGRLLI